MSFVKAVQHGLLLNKNGEQVDLEHAEYLMDEGNQLPLANVIYNEYTVKDVYIAYHYRDSDYASYLLKASELDAQVVQAMDRIELLKMFTTSVQERPDWDTPGSLITDPLLYWSTCNIDAQLVLDAVDKALKKATTVTVRPILIVPSDTQSTIHVGNIKQFIETGVINRIPMRIAEPPDVVITPRQYRISSNLKIIASDAVHTLGNNDWDRVIAVFVQGHQWEFSLFPMKHPLQQMLGIYIGTSPPEFKFPGLHSFHVDQTQQHKDAVVQKQVLTELQQFVLARKQHFTQ